VAVAFSHKTTAKRNSSAKHSPTIRAPRTPTTQWPAQVHGSDSRPRVSHAPQGKRTVSLKPDMTPR
jgi:hypothetical protein